MSRGGREEGPGIHGHKGHKEFVRYVKQRRPEIINEKGDGHLQGRTREVYRPKKRRKSKVMFIVYKSFLKEFLG